MIRSFGDAVTEALYDGIENARTRRVPADMRRVILRKLDTLAAAAELGDVASPPGNRLEALRGDLAGYYSIRVNDQWRIIFRWSDGGTDDVRLIDYH